MSALVLDSVEIKLADKPLIALTEEVARGDVLTLMGPSGAGKSSLLSFINGSLDANFTRSGRVMLQGRDITDLPPHARRVGILFQDPLLFPHMSVAENLLFAVPPGAPASQRKALVTSALETAGLSGFEERDPATLSGGQAARVALMRVLLSSPDALLLDEPFSKLDTARRDQLRGFVFAEARRRMLPVVMVTHDEADAAACGGKIIRLAEESA
ncbi:MAG: ATP-binding cassette domain-containing protein [Pseudomonadota bacterium]